MRRTRAQVMSPIGPIRGGVTCCIFNDCATVTTVPFCFFNRLSHNTSASFVVDSVQFPMSNFEPSLCVRIAGYQLEVIDLATGTAITNCSSLSIVPRRRALRATSSPSNFPHRFPVLPEHFVVQHPSYSSPVTSLTSSSPRSAAVATAKTTLHPTRNISAHRGS